MFRVITSQRARKSIKKLPDYYKRRIIELLLIFRENPVPAEYLDKLFDPFFTTRGERGGTGLGLSVCHGIVTEHGGRIYAKTKPGKGATFFVELPIVSGTTDENKVGEEEVIRG